MDITTADSKVIHGCGVASITLAIYDIDPLEVDALVLDLRFWDFICSLRWKSLRYRVELASTSLVKLSSQGRTHASLPQLK